MAADQAPQTSGENPSLWPQKTGKGVLWSRERQGSFILSLFPPCLALRQPQSHDPTGPSPREAGPLRSPPPGPKEGSEVHTTTRRLWVLTSYTGRVWEHPRNRAHTCQAREMMHKPDWAEGTSVRAAPGCGDGVTSLANGNAGITGIQPLRITNVPGILEQSSRRPWTSSTHVCWKHVTSAHSGAPPRPAGSETLGWGPSIWVL